MLTLSLKPRLGSLYALGMDIIKEKHEELIKHPIYSKINSLEALRIFMSYHVFAVWDFMSLLKSIQNKVTCVNVPWEESTHDPELVRLINEIVLAEESDLDPSGNASSHFGMYLKAMKEVGADDTLIKSFLSDFDISRLPNTLADVVGYHLDLAIHSPVHHVMASFFYGREKLIPDMFDQIRNVIDRHHLKCPYALYYFERHIELDGDEHGPAAMKALDILVGDSPRSAVEVQKIALESLNQRIKLWDFIAAQLPREKSKSTETLV